MSDLSSHQWRKLRDRVLAEESVCWLCGLPIRFDAPPCSTYSPSVDHIIPRDERPDLTYDRDNCRAAHFGCNSGRRERDPVPMRKSRYW